MKTGIKRRLSKQPGTGVEERIESLSDARRERTAVITPGLRRKNEISFIHELAIINVTLLSQVFHYHHR